MSVFVWKRVNLISQIMWTGRLDLKLTCIEFFFRAVSTRVCPFAGGK